MTAREVFTRLIDSRIPTQVVGGTVLRVDKTRAVCDVKPADDEAAELLDVQLRAVDDGSTTGFILWPVEGSPVLVGLIDNDPNNCVVVGVSRVEQFTLATETDSAGKLWADLCAVLEELTVPTSGGPSGRPINLPAIQRIAQRAAALFTS
ncbi:hypothetical protein Q5H93_21770 [Hymenobacter sp. ASUV-10]|uniref:Uncharacterized protein n=1 Tax=Hymenobacter aranciens TaxID=3063996 RepID=A0ABT9BGJ3_9BACT|nr:hypothetical protein [Hymenobacter sp. ASUV-10]MDO7877385.1 hypothetical protein [Hymenobacter sp. ASUV-10]